MRDDSEFQGLQAQATEFGAAVQTASETEPVGSVAIETIRGSSLAVLLGE